MYKTFIDKELPQNSKAFSSKIFKNCQKKEQKNMYPNFKYNSYRILKLNWQKASAV